MKRTPIAILQHDLGDHPAVRAWKRLFPAGADPESVHVLRERRKSAIYRLTGVGVGGTTVIAKRSRATRSEIERTVYEEALPRLPVTAPRYYGSVADANGGEFHWLLLEDVGTEKYKMWSEEHRALAGRWLGRMHASATRLAGATPLSERLPEGGPGRYLKHLWSGRDNILANRVNPALEAEEVAVLEAILQLHDRLESDWARVEESCEGLPPTLVHNDFRPKNAYVRGGPGGLQLFPIDWETAGWGHRAADLARVDLAAYESALREGSPDLDTSAVPRMARVGQVFRFLAAISWDSPQLAYDTRRYLIEPMSNMRVYRDALSNAVQAAGLAE
ncbi:MAG TPA: aminoglycoside phosphotransferase family protein [Planctomycetota bacterium]|jgi:hypothetical protein|nr:aminoglycoside phosphotransferase family protein [Planctomycetota bacterium]